MKLYRTSNGNCVEEGGSYYRVPESSWDALIAHEDLQGYLRSIIGSGKPATDFAAARLEAPIGSQEVWAAGVTYYRSRSARMAEAKNAGGGVFGFPVAEGLPPGRPCKLFSVAGRVCPAHGGDDAARLFPETIARQQPLRGGLVDATIVAAYLVIGLWPRLRYIGAFAAPVVFAIGVFALMPGLDTPGAKPQFNLGLVSLHAALTSCSLTARLASVPWRLPCI